MEAEFRSTNIKFYKFIGMTIKRVSEALTS